MPPPLSEQHPSVFCQVHRQHPPSKTGYGCLSCCSDGTNVYPRNYDWGRNRNPLGTELSGRRPAVGCSCAVLGSLASGQRCPCFTFYMPSLYNCHFDLNYPQIFRRNYALGTPCLCYGASKKTLMGCGFGFRRSPDPYSRSDKRPNNVRIYNIDPGPIGTPGSRRWIKVGSLWGLGVYLVTWPIWWLVLKDPQKAVNHS